VGSLEERYSRQTVLPELGETGQEKLSNSKVLIVGMGALGIPASLYLAGAGIGNITLIDLDTIELSNLARQIIYKTEHIGLKKVDVVAEHLKALNPHIEIIPKNELFDENNAMELVSNNDFIIDGSDNFSTKFLINDACFFANKPFSHAGILGLEGQTLTVDFPNSPCYRCIFTEPPNDDNIPNCSEAGILGPVAGIISSIQALEAIKSITGIGELLTGHILTFNSINMKSRKIAFKKNKKCPICGENPSITECKAYGIPVCDIKKSENNLNSYLFTFKNNQSVMKAERFLRSQNVIVEPRVTPRQLSDECGICLQIESHNSKEIVTILETQNIEISRFGEFKTF
jgi:molybdopterin-synthase adenylyltransferase